MRPAVVLVATIAVAAAAGTAVSVAQRPSASLHPSNPSPSGAPTLPANQPAVAFGFSVAADLSSQTLVLFGGVDNFTTTWLWNGAAWVRADPATSPPGRYGASEAYDPRTGEVLLFGGTLQTGLSANDTWAWDGRTWQELDAGRGGPAGGAGSDMAWDPSVSELVLVTPPPGGRGGGETWTWNGAHWVRAVAGDLGTSFSEVVIALDPLSNALMAEGCCQVQPDKTLGTLPSTWRWNGSAWSLLRTAVHPLDGSSMEADPSLRRLVLCGCNLEGGLSPEMWVWNGHDWMAGPYPRPPVAPEAEIIDAADSQFLVLGSAIAGADALAQTLQVWTLRGTQWLRLGVATGQG
jgi:hypothetical protein